MHSLARAITQSRAAPGLALSALAALTLAACAGKSPLSLGDDRDAGDSTEPTAGQGAPDASRQRLVDGGPDDNGLSISLVTHSCTGPCADVEIVAMGGFPPYSYCWEDGSTTARRQICPSASTAFVASVMDTGLSYGEFGKAPQTATARVTAEVLQCPGGDAGAQDGGAPANGPCITNPSIEGTPQVGAAFAWDAQGWQQCPWLGLYSTYLTHQVTIGPAPGYRGLPPSDGESYAVIQDTALVLTGFGQELCSPPISGVAPSFNVDLAYAADPVALDGGTSSLPPRVEILGGDAPCSGTDVLWTSPPLTETWSTYCVTLDPAKPTRSITFSPFEKSGSFILVDHLVPVDRCR